MKHDASDQSDDLPKVTLAHLRRAGTICARRLAHEHDDRRSMRRGTGRFRVQNLLLENARLTHVDLGVPTAAHFRVAEDLTAEECRLYDTASRWYVELYHDRPVRSVDVAIGAGADTEVDEWSTRVDTLQIRLVGRVGLTVEHRDGHREVRILRLGRGVPDGDVLDDVEVRFTVLRLCAWATDGLHVSVADLVHGARRDEWVDVASEGLALRQWLAERVGVIRTRIARPEPAPGLDCGSCSFVPGCKAHG